MKLAVRDKITEDDFEDDDDTEVDVIEDAESTGTEITDSPNRKTDS